MPAQADKRPPVATRTIGAIAALSLALHAVVLAVTPFGIHRDEFLYFSMGNHLRLWHMDFPPAIAMLGAVSQFIFGHTVAAARVFPAIEGTILVVLAALFARELGGRRFAQGFAALCVLASPLYLRSSTLFQPVVLDQICWTLALLAIARVARAELESGDRRSAWLSFGVAIGLGLLCKFSILFLCVSVLAAVLLTPMRRELLTPWPWIAVLIMLIIGSPSVVGQITLDYPVVAQMRALNAGQLQHVTPAEYFSMQLMFLGPVGLLVAITGAVAMLVSDQLRRYAAVSLSCILAFLLLLVLHGKPYYIGPIYPALLGAGAVVLGGMNSQRARLVVPAVRWSAVALTIAFSLIALPMSLPILSVTATARYAARFAGGVALRTNHGTIDQLPQDFADMLGWRDEASTLASVYRSLSPAEQRETVIVTGNYGQAGAAEFYASEFKLPPVVSTAGSFWFFGPGKLPGAVVISVGVDVRDLRKFWSSVAEVRRLERPWSVAEERDKPIFVSRGPRTSLQALWP
ncbi:MAG TPA: glycosyltransferase family 39 protein, partial [Gemmatimonadaceae bacterium]